MVILDKRKMMKASQDLNSHKIKTRGKILCIGEILWDLLPEGSKAGGAPMNVALHLRKFGMDVSFAGRVGNDPSGHNLIKYLEEHGLHTELIQIDDNLPTSTVKVHIGSDGNNVSFEIVDNVAWDKIELTDKLKDVSYKSDVIIYGTLASRHSSTRRTVLDILGSNSCLKFLDINLRPPYYARDVVEELMESATVIKMNSEEIKTISGWYGKKNDEKDLAKWISEKYDCEMVCVTRGAYGAIIYGNSEFYEHPGFKVNVRDTVGSGDAFLAGFIAKYLSGESVYNSLEYACATGALVATRAGGTPDYKQIEIVKIIEADNSNNLLKGKTLEQIEKEPGL